MPLVGTLAGICRPRSLGELLATGLKIALRQALALRWAHLLHVSGTRAA